MDKILHQIQDKYTKLEQSPNMYLEGFIHAKPNNYWDYIEVDTLLSLQKPKTYFTDETVFIMYHQITELVLKLIVHELKQITDPALEDTSEISLKLGRLVRYTDLLIHSFSIMNHGMKYEDYNQFRLALAPASGFQSAQFRIIEIYCTSLNNLIPVSRKSQITDATSIAKKFELVYWQDAGHNRITGKKSLMLQQFEDRYLEEFIRLAENMKTSNLNEKLNLLRSKELVNSELENSFRDFDYKYNVEWPLVHLNTAHTYLGKGQQEKNATGGSQWEKYLHPKYQHRVFFPSVWTKEELENWGN